MFFDQLSKVWVKLLVGLVFLVGFVVPVLWLGYRVTFLTWVDNYHFAYTYEYWTGEVRPVQHNGYVYSPFYLRVVHTFDPRPMQVCISSIQRVLNCKLVHFDPTAKDVATGLQGWELFIKWHGRNDYEGPGNTAMGTQYTVFQSLLMNYAFAEHPPVFLVIERELKNDSLTVSGDSLTK
jgi:hypothetical protein